MENERDPTQRGRARLYTFEFEVCQDFTMEETKAEEDAKISKLWSDSYWPTATTILDWTIKHVKGLGDKNNLGQLLTLCFGLMVDTAVERTGETPRDTLLQHVRPRMLSRGGRARHERETTAAFHRMAERTRRHEDEPSSIQRCTQQIGRHVCGIPTTEPNEKQIDEWKCEYHQFTKYWRLAEAVGAEFGATKTETNSVGAASPSRTGHRHVVWNGSTSEH